MQQVATEELRISDITRLKKFADKHNGENFDLVKRLCDSYIKVVNEDHTAYSDPSYGFTPNECMPLLRDYMAERFDLKPRDLRKKSNKQMYVRMRVAFAVVAHSELEMKVADIARYLKKNHATVLHYIKLYIRDKDKDSQLFAAVKAGKRHVRKLMI